MELAVYQLKCITRVWFNLWKKYKAEDAPIVHWVLFKSDLMGCFFSHELREEKTRDFTTIYQESMSVNECHLKFTQHSRYAPEIVSNIWTRMSFFIAWFSHQSINEDKATMLIRDLT